MCIKDLWRVFDVHLLLLTPTTVLLFIYVTVYFPSFMLHISPIPFLRAISCISGSPDNEAKARKKLSQFLLRRNPTDASPVIGFLSLLHFLFPLFFWPCTLFILSISLSSTDLWDQPSKIDSEFFTDHECVSSYVTEAAIKREKRGEQVNM